MGSFSFTLNIVRGVMTLISKISTNTCWALASAKAVSSRPQFRMSQRIPCSRLSLTFSHAALAVNGSARGLNEASTDFALWWSLRKESILQKKEIRLLDTWQVRLMRWDWLSCLDISSGNWTVSIVRTMFKFDRPFLEESQIAICDDTKLWIELGQQTVWVVLQDYSWLRFYG